MADEHCTEGVVISAELVTDEIEMVRDYGTARADYLKNQNSRQMWSALITNGFKVTSRRLIHHFGSNRLNTKNVVRLFASADAPQNNLPMPVKVHPLRLSGIYMAKTVTVNNCKVIRIPRRDEAEAIERTIGVLLENRKAPLKIPVLLNMSDDELSELPEFANRLLDRISGARPPIAGRISGELLLRDNEDDVNMREREHWSVEIPIGAQIIASAQYEHDWPNGLVAMSVHHPGVGWYEFDEPRERLPKGLQRGDEMEVVLTLDKDKTVVAHQLREGTRITKAVPRVETTDDDLPAVPEDWTDKEAVARYFAESEAYELKHGFAQKPSTK